MNSWDELFEDDESREDVLKRLKPEDYYFQLEEDEEDEPISKQESDKKKRMAERMKNIEME